ncbi:unnamed protein product [Owenia fusiformis]|uniref:lysozyme n=1 Tax=Owenia fusiformis TaxID=6347 RepID=A0A8S4NC99_OWEFU|nr:unnamed protein product [Owenia fusiformis]
MSGPVILISLVILCLGIHGNVAKDCSDPASILIQLKKDIDQLKREGLDKSTDNQLRTILESFKTRISTIIDCEIVQTYKRTLKALIKNIGKILKLLRKNGKAFKSFKTQFTKSIDVLQKISQDIVDCIQAVMFNQQFYNQKDAIENSQAIIKKLTDLKSNSREVKQLLSKARKWQNSVSGVSGKIRGLTLNVPNPRFCQSPFPPPTPENGFVAQLVTSPCVYVIWCKPGYKLLGRSRYDTDSPVDDTETETKCLVSAIGYWPLNRQDEGKNFADNFHNPSTDETIAVEDAKLIDIKYQDGIQGGRQGSVQVSTSHGSSSCIEIPNENGLLTFVGSFTWLLYVQPRRRQGNGFLLDYSTSNKVKFNIRMVEFKLVTTIVTSTGETFEHQSDTEVFTLKNWVYIGVSFDAETNTIRLFIDGELLFEMSIEPEGDVLADSDKIVLGKSATGNEIRKMRFACVSAFNLALNVSGIQEAMARCIQANLIASWPFDKRNGQRDASGNGNHATSFFTMFASGVSNENKGSMQTGKRTLDNGKELITYIEIPTLRIDRVVTFAAYIYIDDLADNSPIVDFSSAESTGFQIWILKGGRLFARIAELDQTGETDSITVDKYKGKPVVKKGTWHHIAFTYSGHTGVATLFVDGDQVAKKVLSTYKNVIFRPGFLGKTLRNNACFNGRFTCVQIFEAQLNQAEIIEAIGKCKKLPAVKGGTKDCGKQPMKPMFGRIVGGQPALENSWPWMARFTYRGFHFCGGTLFKERVIISAAHCFNRYAGRENPWENIKVYIGSHLTDDPSRTEQEFEVETIIMHPDFNSLTFDNDVAMVFLKRAVKYNDGVQPACLTDREVEDDYECIATGWGRTQNANETTNLLRQAKIPIRNRTVCNQRMQNDVSNNMICGGYWEGGIDTCTGDSGGPLMCQFGKDPTYRLVGIVSWGEGFLCGSENKAGIYTNVLVYIKWITNNVKIPETTTKATTTTTTTTTPMPTTSVQTTVPTQLGFRGIHWTSFDQCLDCICEASENGCLEGLTKCFKDNKGVERCGPFALSETDWFSCNKHGVTNGFNWKTCAIHKVCSRDCVSYFLKKEGNTCFLEEVCEDYARLWYFKQPSSCFFHDMNVDFYWSRIETSKCYGGTLCLDCICHASGCETNLGKCVIDEGVERCGPMQISFEAWKECGRPGGDFKKCTMSSMACSRHCVVKYLNRYRGDCTRKSNPADITCEEDARLWFAGPTNGCKDMQKWTTEYWERVEHCLEARSGKQ